MLWSVRRSRPDVPWTRIARRAARTVSLELCLPASFFANSTPPSDFPSSWVLALVVADLPSIGSPRDFAGISFGSLQRRLQESPDDTWTALVALVAELEKGGLLHVLTVHELRLILRHAMGRVVRECSPQHMSGRLVRTHDWRFCAGSHHHQQCVCV